MPAHISYEWVPEPGVYAERMWAVSEALRDASGPLLFAAHQTREEIRASFLSETSPDGKEWVDWADSYYEIAEAYPNEGILRQSTRLYDAATNLDSFIVTDDELLYNTEDWPRTRDKHQIQYGWVHQDGNATVPQREFVGLSAEGKAKVEGAFIEWFDNSLALFVTKSGKLGIRGRSSLGTFVGMEPAPFTPGRRRIR